METSRLERPNQSTLPSNAYAASLPISEKDKDEPLDDKELMDLRPIKFITTKRQSIDENKDILFGAGIGSTMTRNLKLNQKPVDIMKNSGIKDLYFKTLAKADKIDRDSIEQRRKILKTVHNDQSSRIR